MVVGEVGVRGPQPHSPGCITVLPRAETLSGCQGGVGVAPEDPQVLKQQGSGGCRRRGAGVEELAVGRQG